MPAKTRRSSGRTSAISTSALPPCERIREDADAERHRSHSAATMPIVIGNAYANRGPFAMSRASVQDAVARPQRARTRTGPRDSGRPRAGILSQAPAPTRARHQRWRRTGQPRRSRQGPSHAPNAASSFTSPAPMPPSRKNGKKSARPTPHPATLAAKALTTAGARKNTNATAAAPNVRLFGMRRVRRSDMQAMTPTASAARLDASRGGMLHLAMLTGLWVPKGPGCRSRNLDTKCPGQ